MKNVVPTRSFVADGIGSFEKGHEYRVTEAHYKVIQQFVRTIEDEPLEVVEDIVLSYDSD